MYKMCLKIIYLIYIYKKDLALTHPQCLICHETKPNRNFIHCWKDSSGIPLSSVGTSHFKAYTLSKQIPLIIPLDWGKERRYSEQDQVNREISLERSCSSWYSAYLFPLFFKYAQIFGDNLLNPVLFHVKLTCDFLNN